MHVVESSVGSPVPWGAQIYRFFSWALGAPSLFVFCFGKEAPLTLGQEYQLLG
jgi:hypothetical protein